MSEKITRKLPNPEGVAAGGTMTFRIPTGRRIHAFYFNYNDTDQDITDFTEFRLYVNSNLIQRFSGVQRDTLNQFDGLAAAAGSLVLSMDRINLLTVAGEEETALNTGVADAQGRKISSMYMEVDVLAGATIAASDISLYAKESDSLVQDINGNPIGPGSILYIRPEQRTIAGADTDFQISDLINPGVNAYDKINLNRVTFIPSANALTNLKIDRNNYTIFDRTDALNRVIQAAGVRAPQSGYYTIDTTENARGGEMIDLFGMTDYRYRVAASGAMTLTALSEYIGVLPQ